MACSSYMKVSEYIFEWTYSVNRRLKVRQFDKSGVFYAGAEKESSWYMKFYPAGDGNDREGNSSLVLVMMNGMSVKLSSKVIMKSLNGTVIAERSMHERSMEKSDEWPFRDFVATKELGYEYKISCELKITENNVLPYVRRIKDFNCVISDMHSLLSEQKDTDLLVVSQNQQEFRAHKTVAAARSPVFAAMFQNECQESLKGRIEISDMSGSDLEEMLLYMYSGNLSKWSHGLCMSLYEAGDKYKINGLKETCSRYLQDNLTDEISVKCLIISDMHSDEDFKKTVMKYIKKHVKEVLKTSDWKSVVQEHHHLVDEIILAVSVY